MDQPSPPTAADLGITEIEYERIMRGLRERNGEELSSGTTHALQRPQWFLPVVGLLLVVAAVLFRSGPGEVKPAYAFLAAVDGHPVTYSSCRPVQVAVYPAGGPPDAADLVREAVTRLRPLTGLDIVVVGIFGGHAPNWNFEAGPVLSDDPVSVSWQDGQAIAHLTDDVAGLGGSRSVTAANGTKRLTAGTIALSRDYYTRLAERGDHDEELAVLLHEFGHVLGLDHVDSRHELMNRHNVGLTSFGPGDLEGLRLVGHGPCI